MEQTRIERIFHLEGNYNDYTVHLPDYLSGNQKLRHMIKSIIQMPLKH